MHHAPRLQVGAAREALRKKHKAAQAHRERRRRAVTPQQAIQQALTLQMQATDARESSPLAARRNATPTSFPRRVRAPQSLQPVHVNLLPHHRDGLFCVTRSEHGIVHPDTTA